MRPLVVAAALIGIALLALVIGPRLRAVDHVPFDLMLEAQAQTPKAKSQGAIAPAWVVDQPNSAIGFRATSSGETFNGRFQRWTADIKFDPANLSGSSARVVIDLSSANTGDRTRDTTLAEPEWFDRGKSAVFQSASFRSVGPNRFEAQGTLAIKGINYPVVLPFSLTITGARADMAGQVTLDRTRMNVGMKTDPTGEWISKAVAVDVRVRANRK